MADADGYDGVPSGVLAARLGVPRVEARGIVGSTLDVAHELAAAGAERGTLVIADTQTAGRGRQGRTWTSPSGSGVWLALIEREMYAEAVGVLSLRMGMAAAKALDSAAGATVLVKWPNDLNVAAGKLGGILVEARWREQHLEWAAIGLGINLRPPAGVSGAAGLGDGVSRIYVLELVVPALRRAALSTGRLSPLEVEEFSLRDFAAGRRCTAPVAGRVGGLTQDGALVVHGDEGPVLVRSGSLVFTTGREAS